MYASGLHQHRFAPSAAVAPAVAALWVNECGFDTAGVSIPRAEPHLVVRFGPSARRGLDFHAIGARQRAHRKVIRSGQRTVMVRLHLGTHGAVFGVPSSVIADRIVPLEDLWGVAATRELGERLFEARQVPEVVAILEEVIARRLPASEAHEAPTQLALDAAARLGTARVNDVAKALGVSERTLRRVFREAVGMSPKEFSQLTRFHRALREARAGLHVDWAGIASATGYYDQAHLIAEFRKIVGVTPRAFLGELRGAASSTTGRERGARSET
ncbi:helix-turn-helix domain-containing protein [Chondromyces crocatus]|uniref:HTH araC/xylS-type domain-containing protein n=1 Tax=Chondromyces crocatus TaxID=52 RepID=A0A0K1ELB3_CHOCO|nr:helix-turn-helix transcriptional regulator [Chondromyces crocatus]AKT41467.1 uncharacterized protein CMC5_056700 [Chondromyces crocatus]